LLAEFHRGLYWDAFALQHEPLSAWRRALAGEAPYTLTVRLACEGRALVGGICFERYPRSGCGLVTYLVVAPSHRRQGLGYRLQHEAVQTLGGTVFGEVAPALVHRNLRWGARVVDVPYVQPALGPGLERDRGLTLLALEPTTDTLSGAVVRTFLEELYAATEGGPPDPAIRIGATVALILAQPSGAG
jgi:GNAT superfamily N-acetyltransferase